MGEEIVASSVWGDLIFFAIIGLGIYLKRNVLESIIDEIKYTFEHGFFKIKKDVFSEEDTWRFHEESQYQEPKQEEAKAGEEQSQKVNPQKRYTNTQYAEMLGIKHGATKAEIKIAYRRMAKKYHSDVNANEDDEMMKLINRAHQELMKMASYG